MFVMDYSADRRIRLALETIKNDLIEMRNTDIVLLRQLMYINDTIKTLMRNRAMTRTQSCHNYIYSHNKLITRHFYKSEISKQQSVPSFCQFSGSCTSLDESTESSQSMFYIAESDEDISKCDYSSMTDNLTYIKDDYFEGEKNDTQNYEDLLKNNIKEWKTLNTVELNNEKISSV